MVTVNLENASVTSDGLEQDVNNFLATLDVKNMANARMARVSALKVGMDGTVHYVSSKIRCFISKSPKDMGISIHQSSRRKQFVFQRIF